MNQLEPGSSIAGSVEEQIAQAQQQLGTEPDVSSKPAEIEPAPVTGPEKMEPDVSADKEGIKLNLSASDELVANMPSNSILFIIIRSAGPVAGPPLGVRRISNPAFPLELTISDQDSMMAERQISSESELRLQARLSLSGAPNAQSGDWQSDPITVSWKTLETVQLVMDQRVDY